MLVATAAGAFFALSAALELSEMIGRWTGGFERWQLDELPLTLTVLALGLAWFASRRVGELRTALEAQARAETESALLLRRNRDLARQLIGVQEDERRTIARELHDELGQYLSAIKVDAVSIAQSQGTREGSVRTSARAIANAADHMHAIANGMLTRLRPAGLDELGLAACLQELAETWEARHGIECVFLPEGDLGEFGESVNITVYRMVQESLSNVARHSQAQRVAVRLVRDGPQLIVSVENDGKVASNTDATEEGRGLGLLGMNERVGALGGTLSIEAGAHGMRVTALLPVPEAGVRA